MPGLCGFNKHYTAVNIHWHCKAVSGSCTRTAHHNPKATIGSQVLRKKRPPLNSCHNDSSISASNDHTGQTIWLSHRVNNEAQTAVNVSAIKQQLADNHTVAINRKLTADIQ